MTTWNDANETIPDHGGTVVCRTADRALCFGRVMRVGTDHIWIGYPDGLISVTHWFDLPPTPETHDDV